MFGSRLWELGMQQNEIAKLTGASTKSVFDWLHGNTDPLLSTAFVAAKGLGFDLDDLCSLDPLPPRRREPEPQRPTSLTKNVGRTRFGEALDLYLVSNGLTAHAVNIQLGLSRGRFQWWRLGKKEPKLFYANMVAEQLGFRLHAMCEGRLEPR